MDMSALTINLSLSRYKKYIKNAYNNSEFCYYKKI
jgi:hypothetical protein